MQRLILCFLAFAPALTGATEIRRLEDAAYYGGDGYFKFAKCIRAKIRQNNDDDGNTYFYNGAYRSQSVAYASFIKCEKGCDGTCDPSLAYVTELGDVIENVLVYSQGYCEACANQCRRRRLDEAGGANAAQYAVDCNTCASQCSRLMNGGGSNGADETAYLVCQYSFTDSDGLDYYSAPACSSDGMLTMGLFYDEECTIKKTDDQSDFGDKFAYNSFHTVESICMNCQDGVCSEIARDAVACLNGQTADGGNDDMGVCKAYKRMAKEWQYATAKKKSPLPIIVLGIVVLSTFCFLAYTYYVRHKNANMGSTKTALLEAEKDYTPASGEAYTQTVA